MGLHHMGNCIVKHCTGIQVQCCYLSYRKRFAADFMLTITEDGVASGGFGVINIAAGDMLYGVKAQLVVPVLNASILHV